MLSDLERQWNDQIEPTPRTTSGEVIAAFWISMVLFATISITSA